MEILMPVCFSGNSIYELMVKNFGSLSYSIFFEKDILGGDLKGKALKTDESIVKKVYGLIKKDRLIYAISNYNGTIQQYIHCLISIRFKSKVQNIKLNALSLGEIDALFEISKYFPKQQFRRCFIQTEFGFGVKLENKKVIILI